MSSSPAVSSNVGTRLLFENDRVRVWDLRLAPGESTGLHRHTTDYLYVVIGDGTLQGKRPDGTVQPPESLSDGEVRFRQIDGEDTQEAVNVGETPWRNIIVELK